MPSRLCVSERMLRSAPRLPAEGFLSGWGIEGPYVFERFFF